MKITMYSTNCPMCKVLESKLNAKNIKFDLIEDIEVMREKGFLHAPQLEIDGIVHDFSSARKLIDAFDPEVKTFESYVLSQKAE